MSRSPCLAAARSSRSAENWTGENETDRDIRFEDDDDSCGNRWVDLISCTLANPPKDGNGVDPRVLLNRYPPVKLADNIVTPGQTLAAGNVWQPTAVQQTNIMNYLNGLYGRGAKPGDFAVIRLNLDASQAGYDAYSRRDTASVELTGRIGSRVLLKTLASKCRVPSG